jgi:hypothetical protein
LIALFHPCYPFARALFGFPAGISPQEAGKNGEKIL